MTYTIQEAQAMVDLALKQVKEANDYYITACKHLADAKLEAKRAEGHPWLGLRVYRVMGGADTTKRLEHGTVCFKEYTDPDYGNGHIAPGTFYVLTDAKEAKFLEPNWMVELF